MTLVEFLRARLDADEAYARNAFGDHNDAGPEWREIWSGELSLCTDDRETVNTGDSQVSRFMERFDPARVLAEVDAKRKLISDFEHYDSIAKYPDCDGGIAIGLECAVALAALPYDWHDDYDESWRP